jgi:serine/threonine-protein kinase
MHPATIGRYEIKSELGRGGMATVFHAHDPRFKREVALKILPREFLHDLTFRARFEREAQTIASLEHPAIVPVYDFGEEDGQPFIVMRLMPGGSLTDRLKTGPLPLEEAARIFNTLAPALDEAHAHGIIHRDLKPGNILFDNRSQPYLSDFGIAKLSEGSAAFTGSSIIGTPAYMSPEQAKGERNIDGRSDLYALGAILFESLTGKLPYEADTPMGIAIKHIVEPVPRILDTNPQLPPACESIISRAMAKDRTDRFANAQEMAAMLATVARGEPLPAAAAPLPKETAPAPARATVTPAATVTASPGIPSPVTVPLASRSRIPPWAWAGGGLLGVAVIGLAVVMGMNLFGGGGSPTATGEPTSAAQAQPTPVVGVTRAPTNTAPPATATLGAGLYPTNPPDSGPTATPAPQDAPLSITIDAIAVSEGQFIVEYHTEGYDPSPAGAHMHFFFDTVTPDQAGAGGLGPYEVYAGPNPFTRYKVSDRPAGANRICALVANPDHTVRPGSGNCVRLPPIAAPPTSTVPPPTAAPQRPNARITGITVSGDSYVISFNVGGFNYGLPGPHVHFFFDSVAPEQAGVPGAGPWELYGGQSPYTTLGPLMVSKRGAATAMCVLVANADHSIQLNTGNCVPLP